MQPWDTHFSHSEVKCQNLTQCCVLAGGGGVQPDHPGGGRVGPPLPEHLPSGSAEGPAAPRGRRPAAPGDLPVRPGL